MSQQKTVLSEHGQKLLTLLLGKIKSKRITP